MTAQDRIRFRELLTDPQVEALTAYGEARNQSVTGLIAVINTIRNRARIRSTRSAEQALKTAAYSCWLDDSHSTNDNTLSGLAYLIAGGEPLPYDPVLDVCVMLASRHDLADVTGGATHYYNPKAVKEAPSWTKTDATHHPVNTAIIGDHSFWAKVAF